MKGYSRSIALRLVGARARVTLRLREFFRRTCRRKNDLISSRFPKRELCEAFFHEEKSPPDGGDFLIELLGYCSRQRNRNVTIWARVQSSFGAKSVALTPLVMPSSTAQSMAGA